VLDVCQADCNANQVADACDLLTGIGLDCDASGVLDSCEVDCNGPCDGDGDGQTVVLCDCDDANGTAWAQPGPAVGLELAPAGAATALTWSAPASPGASALTYDTLRASAPDGFVDAVVCLDVAGTDTLSADPDTPAAGSVYYYLIRVDNGCPGAGNAGTNSDGVLRQTGPCRR